MAIDSAFSPFSLFSPFSQTIKSFLYDPTTNWSRFFNPEVNFNFNPQDSGVEAHVLSKTGSYGSQISTIIDALDALARHLPREGLSQEDTAALDALDALRKTATKAVDEFRSGISVDAIVNAARQLQKSNPDAIREVKERLGE